MLSDMTDLARTLTFTPSLSLSWISSNDQLIFLPHSFSILSSSKWQQVKLWAVGWHIGRRRRQANNVIVGELIYFFLQLSSNYVLSVDFLYPNWHFITQGAAWLFLPGSGIHAWNKPFVRIWTQKFFRLYISVMTW